MNTTKEFSVIIPVFNRWDMTTQCLASLKKHTPNISFEVIVVDNSSTDETATALGPLGKALFSSAFKRIRFEENRNFAGACNAGAASAAAPLLFFLNNDTILTENWFSPLLDALREDSKLGAVGPLLTYGNELVQHGGVVLGPLGFLHLYRYFPKSHPVFLKKRKLQAITAAAMMTRADLFNSCGGFYEGYKNGFEDVELCARLRQANTRLAVVPKSRIYHLESQTSGRMDHEKDNAQLLSERCEKMFLIDLHQHAARDGFDVGLDPAGAVFFKLKPAQENELDNRAMGQPPEAILEEINNHPLWQKGYTLLAPHLMKTGDLAGALHLCHRGFMVSRNELSATRLLDVAEKAKEYAVADNMRNYLEQYHKMRSDKEAAIAHFNGLLRRVKRLGDAFLYDLYKNRLNEIKAGK